MSHTLKTIPTTPNVATPATEAFCEKLEWFHHISGTEPGATNAARDLIQLCGSVFDLEKEMPFDHWHDVRFAIGNPAKADEWERLGRTFAGAAVFVVEAMHAKIHGRDPARYLRECCALLAGIEKQNAKLEADILLSKTNTKVARAEARAAREEIKALKLAADLERGQGYRSFLLDALPEIAYDAGVMTDVDDGPEQILHKLNNIAAERAATTR